MPAPDPTRYGLHLSPPPPSRARRLARWALWSVPILAGGVLALGGIVYAAAISAPGNALLLDQLLPRLQPKAGAIRVHRLRTDLLHHLGVDGLRIDDPDGAALIAADHVEVDLDVLSILDGQLDIAHARIDGLQVNLPDLSVFGRMWPSAPASPPWQGLPFDIVVAALELDGNARVGTYALMGASGHASVTARGRQVQVDGLDLRALSNAGATSLVGGVTWSPERTLVRDASLTAGALTAQVDGAIEGDRLAFQVPAAHLDLPSLTAIVPAAGRAPLKAPIDLVVEVGGTTHAPTLKGTLDSAGGSLTVDLGVDTTTREWRAAVQTDRFDSDVVLVGIEPIVAEGRIDATGKGWTWPEEIDADATVDLRVDVRGEHIAAVGPVTLRDGVLHLDTLAADLRWGAATATGDVDLVARHAELSVHEAQVRLERFGQRGAAGFRGAVVADWAGLVTVQARGQLDARGLDTGGVTIARATGPIDAGWDGRNPTGHAELTLQDVHFRDRQADRGTARITLGDRIGFDVALDEPDRSLLTARGVFTRSTGALVLDAADVELADGLRAVAQGEQSLRIRNGQLTDAHLDLLVGGARIQADGSPGTGPVTIDAKDLDLVLLEKLDARYAGYRGVVDAHAEVSGQLDAPTIHGTAQAKGLVIPGQVDGLDGDVIFDSDGRVVKLELHAGSEGATLATIKGTIPLAVGSGGARLDKDATLDAHFLLSPLETEALEKLLVGRTFPKAHAEGEVDLSGTLHAPQAELRAKVQLRGEGTPAASVRATIVDGKVAGDASVTVDGEPHATLHVDTHVDPAALRAWVDGGPLPALTGPLGGSAEIKRLPMATLRRFVNVPEDLTGDLDGALTFGGTVDAPTVGGDLAILDGRINDIGLQTATLHLAHRSEGYEVAADVAFARMASTGTKRQRLLAKARAERPSCAASASDPAGSVRVEGFVPLAADLALDRPGLDLSVSGAGFPLAAAESFTTQLVDTSGCLVLGGKIGGSIATPDLQLSLDLEDAATAIPALGIRVDDVVMDASFDGSAVQLRSLTARTSPGLSEGTILGPQAGRVRMTGSAAFGEATSAEARMSFDHAWVMARADQRAQLSGDIKLKLADGKVATTGRLVLDEGYLKVGERFFAGDRATRLDPDIELVRSTPVIETLPATEERSLLFLPSIDIDLARHARIDVSMPLQGGYGDLGRALTTVIVRSDMDGTLHLAHSDEKLRVTGEIETQGGRADVLGRPFELGEGTVAFTGTDYTAPILDLHATHHASAGDIAVAIGGVPSSPTLVFTSDTIAEDDVLPVLVLGAPLDELDAGAGTSAIMGVVGSLVRNQVESNTESLFRIDNFSIDQSQTSVGLALGRNLTLTTGYHFDVTDPTRENLFDVSLAFALPKRWYLELGSGSAGVSSAEAYWKLRF